MEELQKQIDELKAQMGAMDARIANNKLSMIVFSGDLDKALAAFIIGTGAVAMGMEVVMFFTFWGTPMLRAKDKALQVKIPSAKCLVPCYQKVHQNSNCPA